MEYLAAEAFVRNAGSIDDVVDRVLSIFASDPSSVIPDVMVQAMDDKFDKGAELTLIALADRGKAKQGKDADRFLALCLRIVNSAPMSRAIAESLTGIVMSYWKRSGPIDQGRESTVALLQLYRDPRSKILSAARGATPTRWRDEHFVPEQLREQLLRRWARIDRLRMSELFEPEWHEDIRSLVALCDETMLTTTAEIDPIFGDYMLTFVSSANPPPGKFKPSMVVSAFGERAPGSGLIAIRDNLCHGSRDGQLVKALGESIRNANYQTNSLAAGLFLTVLAEEIPRWDLPGVETLRRRFARDRDLFAVMTWIGLVSVETYLFPGTFERTIPAEVNQLVQLKETLRSTKRRLARELTIDDVAKALVRERVMSSAKNARRLVGETLPWLSNWLMGRRRLVSRWNGSVAAGTFKSDRLRKLREPVSYLVLETWQDLIANPPEGIDHDAYQRLADPHYPKAWS
jgi:hypothetical protein